MADPEPSPSPDVNPTTEPQEPKPPADPPPKKGDEPSPVPYPRFQEVYQELKELKEWRKEQEEKQRLAKEKKLKEDGEIAELLKIRDEELKTTAEERDEYKGRWDTHEATRRESLISNLPEEERDFWKEQPLAALEKHVESLTKNFSPGTNEARPGKTTEPPDKPWSQQTPSERRATMEATVRKATTPPA